MESDAVTAPPGAAKIMEMLKTEQKSFNDQRMELIESLRLVVILSHVL